MPRRTDSNQAAIMAALRKVGALVLDLHELGRSAPDLLVLFHRRLVLLEAKSSSGHLTPGQAVFHAVWLSAGAPLYTVRTVEEAMSAIGAEVYE